LIRRGGWRYNGVELLSMSGSVLTEFAWVAGAGLLALLALRWLRRSLGNAILSGMPRLQHKGFVDRLRAAAFADPISVVGTLAGNNAVHFLNRLWGESRGETQRMAASLAKADPANVKRFAAMTETDWPAEPLAARAVPFADGWSLGVVTLPTPEQNNETYFFGVAVPTKAVERGDLELARRSVRCFELNKWSMGRETDLVEETSAGRRLTYNIGTSPTVEAFAVGIAEKITDRPLAAAAHGA